MLKEKPLRHFRSPGVVVVVVGEGEADGLDNVRCSIPGGGAS